MNPVGFDGVDFQPVDAIPASAELWSFPDPVILTPGTPGADLMLAAELYPYHLPAAST